MARARIGSRLRQFAGARCRRRSGTERAGVPGKKKKMFFTLSWTVRAKRVPLRRRCSRTFLTSSIQTRRIAALTPGELARLAGLLVSTGLESVGCTALDAGGFAAGDVHRGAAWARVRVIPFRDLALPHSVGAARSLSVFCVALDVEFFAVLPQLDRRSLGMGDGPLADGAERRWFRWVSLFPHEKDSCVKALVSLYHVGHRAENYGLVTSGQLAFSFLVPSRVGVEGKSCVGRMRGLPPVGFGLWEGSPPWNSIMR